MPERKHESLKVNVKKMNKTRKHIILIMIIIFLSNSLFKTLCVDLSDIDIGLESNTDQIQESTFQVPDEKWTSTALKYIAHYIRNYKFNEWDRRFFMNKPNKGKIGFYSKFPEPPVRILHWKVRENCESNFYKCIIYLYSTITITPFTRNEDTTVNLWNEYSQKSNSNSMRNYSIKQINDQCKESSLNAEKTDLPFDSPSEKFKWRTSAAYYMCWYTMLGLPALSMIGEACDNFANCLDPTFGEHNRDIRSDDRKPFACALHSFCPDPCCPIKYLGFPATCFNSNTNPCFAENGKDEWYNRYCNLNRKDNQNLDSIIANKWNVSCHCKYPGFKWKSNFGMCVDINECNIGEHNCNNVTQDCFNLPGTFACLCSWGYIYNETVNNCVVDSLFQNDDQQTESLTIVDSLLRFLQYFF